MEEQVLEKTKINYYIIFLIILIANIVVLFSFNYLFKQVNDTNIIVENISKLNNKINDLVEIVKINNSEVKLTDRLDPELIRNFGSDDEFLNKIVKLKKQIIKRELESKVVKLESEKIARNNTSSDGAYALGYKKQVAANIFEIMMINATTKKVVIRVEDNITSLGVGDNIRGFIIKKINANQVIMKNPDGDDEVLRFSYLTKKIYEKQENGDKNVK